MLFQSTLVPTHINPQDKVTLIYARKKLCSHYGPGEQDVRSLT